MTLESLRAADILAEDHIKTEVIDIRTLRPLDENLILQSVHKTGRLIVVDTGWKTVGFSGEIVARVTEEALSDLKCPPRRIALPDCPTPTAPALADFYYPRAACIVATTRKMLEFNVDERTSELTASVALDVPDTSFTGPF